jgi:hypothetical protein
VASYSSGERCSGAEVADIFDKGADGVSGLAQIAIARSVNLLLLQGFHEAFGRGAVVRIADTTPARTEALISVYSAQAYWTPRSERWIRAPRFGCLAVIAVVSADMANFARRCAYSAPPKGAGIRADPVGESTPHQ